MVKIGLFSFLFFFWLTSEAEEFFRTDTAYLQGKIIGFQGKTGTIPLTNGLNKEVNTILLEIDSAGNFHASLPLYYPVSSYIELQETGIPFYISPGDTLHMLIQWTASFCPDIKYTGKAARINQELFQARNIKFPDIQMPENVSDNSTRMAYEQSIRKAYEDYKIEIRKLSDQALFLPQTRKLLLDEAMIYQAEKLLYFDQYIYLSNTEFFTIDPTTDPYYYFLREISWDDPALLSTRSFYNFIDLFDRSIISYKKWKIQKNPEMFFQTLKKAGYLLTATGKTLKEDYKKTTREKNISSEEFIEKQKKWQNLEKQYSDSLLYDLAQQILYRETVFLKEMHLKPGIFWEILNVRLLKNALFYSSDRSTALRQQDFILNEIKNPLCVSLIHQIVDKEFPVTKRPAQSLVIPEGPAADILKKITSPYLGKVILIDIWAVWCGPCLDGISYLQPVREKYIDRDMAFLFISSEKNSPEEAFNQIMKPIEGYKYRLNDDEYNYFCQLFKIETIPHYIIIDQTGKVIYPDYKIKDTESLEAILDSLLK